MVLDDLHQEQSESLKSEQIQHRVHSTVKHDTDGNNETSQIVAGLFKLKYLVLEVTEAVHVGDDEIRDEGHVKEDVDHSEKYHSHRDRSLAADICLLVQLHYRDQTADEDG